MKNILRENMRRFRTKNLLTEQEEKQRDLNSPLEKKVQEMIKYVLEIWPQSELVTTENSYPWVIDPNSTKVSIVLPTGFEYDSYLHFHFDTEKIYWQRDWIFGPHDDRNDPDTSIDMNIDLQGFKDWFQVDEKYTKFIDNRHD